MDDLGEPRKKLLLMGQSPASKWSACMPSLVKLAPQLTAPGNDRSGKWMEEVREHLRMAGSNAGGSPSSGETGRFVVLQVPEALLVRLDRRVAECAVSRDDYVAKSVELALWLSANEQQAIGYKIGELVSLLGRFCVPKIREVFRFIAELEAESLDKAAESSDVDQQE